MDTSSARTKLRRNMFLKAWERCKSLGFGRKMNFSGNITNSSTRIKPCDTRARSSPSLEHTTKIRNKNHHFQVAPAGCFTVYVGEEKQRFVIKAKLANHPLFKLLLDDAESIYGFNGRGPLLLPCDVDLFYKVLAEIESGEEISTGNSNSFSAILRSPLIYSINKKHGAYDYRLLSASEMLKLNRTTVF